MSEVDAMYRAVLANPDIEDPRMVYADAVQAAGDEPLAELIRVQCEFHPLYAQRLSAKAGACPVCGAFEGLSHAYGCHFSVLSRRESELLDAHRKRWVPVCPKCKGSGEVEQMNDLGHTEPWPCAACRGTLIGGEFKRGSGLVSHEWDRGLLVVGIGSWVCFRNCEHGHEASEWLRELVASRRPAAVIPYGAVGTREYGGGHDQPAVWRSTVPRDVWSRLCPDARPDHEFAEHHDRGELERFLGRAVVLGCLDELDRLALLPEG